MKIALVYDRVNKFGGAERVLKALHEIWPDAPLYTAVYDKKRASWADSFKVIPSWLGNVPGISTHHELIPFLMPFAFESFSFDQYDVVLSVTSSDAKGICTKPGTLHICYLLTPYRLLWNGYQSYMDQPGFGKLNGIVRTLLPGVIPSLRTWDVIASTRPDHIIAISRESARRCTAYYHLESEIIYPPVDPVVYNMKPLRKYFYLVVSRLVPYKGLDYAIELSNRKGFPLKIVGRGIDKKRLQQLAGKQVQFVDGYLTEKELGCYYESARGVICPGEEDFGLAAVEAQAYGTPVIALGRGGAAETVISGKTGILYSEPSPQSLGEAIEEFEKMRIQRIDCRKQAEKFSKKKFQTSMKAAIETLWKEYRKVS